MAPKELSLSSAASRSPPRPELRSVSVAVSPPPRSSPKLRSFRNVENLSLPPLETQRSVSESFGQSIASASSKLASSSGRHEGIGSSNSSMATSNSAITSSPHRPKSIQSSHGQAASPSLKAFLSTPEGKKAREHADSASFSLDSRAEGDFSTHASSPEKSHASSGESRRHIMYADRGQLGSDERTGGAREMELQSFVDSDGKDEGLHLEEFDDAVSQTLVPAKEQRDQKGSKQTWVCWKVLICTGIGLIVVSVLGMAAMILGPLLFKKVILPVMEWEEHNLSRPLLAFVAVACMSLFPIVMLPTGPSMWLLGIVFNYFWGFCFIMIGAFFGQSLPYAFGHWLMHDRVQSWLSSSSRLTAVLRLADSGGWFQQFKTTLFLRMSPFPYLLFNYAITATEIKYGPYICASMVAMIPETFIAIYCGKLIQKLAMAHNDPLRRPVTPLEIAYEVLGLCVAGSVVVVGMIHGRRAFKDLEMQERLQREGQGQEMLDLGTPSKGDKGGDLERGMGLGVGGKVGGIGSKSGRREGESVVTAGGGSGSGERGKRKETEGGVGAAIQANLGSLREAISGYARLSRHPPPGNASS